MQEISQFLTLEGGGGIYLGASDLYERVARAMASDDSELEALRQFFKTGSLSE